jgi:hypothetical protein
MDPRLQVVGMLIVCATAAYIAKVVVNAVLRMREPYQPREMAAIEERLARIEASVDAIAIEVERAGELQRFTARITEGKPEPEPLRTVGSGTTH